MKTFQFVRLAFVCCIGLLTLCPAQVRADEAIRIGMILPLTGPAAEYGIAIQNAVTLAKRKDHGPLKNVQFDYEDAAYNVSQAVSSFNKLAEVSKVRLVYTWGIPFCRALAPLADARKLPTVGQCIDRDSAKGRKYYLRFMNYTDQYAALQLEYLRSLGKQDYAIVLAENPYQEELFAAFERAAAPHKILTLDRYPAGEMDFRSTITKLKRLNLEEVGVFLLPGQIAQFYKQAHEQKLKRSTFGTLFFESEAEVLRSAGGMDGAVFVGNEVKSEFSNEYQREFGNASQMSFAALAYEFVVLVGELFGGIQHAPLPDEVMAAFAHQIERDGVAVGRFGYNESPEAGKFFRFPLTVKKVVGGKFEMLSITK